MKKKIEEPLAVVAERKGFSIYWIKKLIENDWVIVLCSEEVRAYVPVLGGKSFHGSTYTEAESSARAFLAGLPVEGGENEKRK